MARRPCIEDGCPTITSRTRCLEHERQADGARGTRQERGYGASHERMRADYVRRIESGEAVTCWRCGLPIADAHDMHLGHDDYDRSVTRGPEHARCNLRAAGLMRHGISPDG